MKVRSITVLVGALLVTGAAYAQGKMDLYVKGSDQSVADGTVMASEVMAGENGWLVVHRTDKGMKPGPVVGYAPLKRGKNTNVVAILQEPIKSGEMLMLMLHSEDGGKKPGVFEYTLGAKEDGPVRMNDKLVTAMITTK